MTRRGPLPRGGTRWYREGNRVSARSRWKRPLDFPILKRATAPELLAPIYDWFTEGFDTADLQEAEDLLETLA